VRSRLFTLAVAAIILAVVVAAISLRGRMRCAGFSGEGVTPADLPPPAAAGTLRVVTWNLRNFPLDERPEDADLGYSRRTNICDLEDALTGLDADVLVLSEVNDTRRFPPILRRSASDDQAWRIAFTPRGGRFGQKVAVAWDDRLLELVAEPVVLESLEVSDGARPGIAVRLATRDGASDLTVIGLHLESTPGAWPRRKRQLEALASEVVGLVERFGDEDLFVAGDFNTSGWRDGTPERELARVDRILRRAGLARLRNTSGCTAFWDGPRGRDGLFLPTATDHVYLRGAAVRGASSATSWLHCARLGCDQPLLSAPGAEDGTFFDVSDHCPVVVDVPIASAS
jgi:endonuclease/exonuclease/phosphatase family metal-dependent hydrolase